MDHSRSSPALWLQLLHTSKMVQGVRLGRSLTAQLQSVATDLRPSIQALAFHAMRWLGLAEGVRNQLIRHPPSGELDALLCTALSLLVVDGERSYSDFTLVNQAVEAAKRRPATKHAASMVNACLRRFLREREALLECARSRETAARYNHPSWWVERMQTDHPHRWQAVLQTAQGHAPMMLRVNAQRTTASRYLQRLTDAGLEADIVGPYAVRLKQPCAVQAVPGFAEGDVSVQAVAAQRAAPLLLRDFDKQPLRILDACAAPGGKTAHLLELAPNADVTALESDPARSVRIHENLRRLGLAARVLTADAAQPDAWWDGELFDAILLDAPCSASGIVHRHPDIRWLRRPTDIDTLALQQDRLINALWPVLRPGGRLLYCTCSVFRQEGDERIKTFVAHNTDATLQASPGHLLPSKSANLPVLDDNAECDDDGFYYALLAKSAA